MPKSSSDSGEFLDWTDEAVEKLQNVPFFARTQARQQIEKLAIERGCEEVTAELVEEARRQFGQ